ncbi:SurA N-terminal domain-containing protein [Thermodesulfobacteriota bacterium]
MANILSNNIQQIIIKVILGLIALVFVFWGFGGYNTKKSVIVASVNGIDISKQAHEKAYENLLTNFKNQMSQVSGDISNELLSKLNFREKALDELIKKILLQQEAKDLHLYVNSEEVKEAIKSYPAFQENGRFNLDRYKYILRQSRLIPAEFEQNREDMLLLSKVENIVKDSVQISEDEVLIEFKRRNEKVSVDFISFNPVAFEGEAVATDADLKKYFDDNASSFDIPSKVKVEILAFENDEYAKKVSILDGEIKSYYDNNIEEYALEKEVKASHILIKSEIGDDPQKREDARKKAEDVLAKIDGGADFAELAKEYSEDTETAADGGNMGWFQKGKGDWSVGMIAFPLEIDEVSDVTALREGFHIVKVTDKKEERQKELDKVRDEIIAKLSSIKGRELIDDLTRKARREVFSSRDVVSYSRKNNVKLITPAPFALNGAVDGIGKHTPFNREVFAVEEGDVGDIIDLNSGSYIVKVVEKIPSKTPSFDEVVAVVKAKVIAEKAKEVAESKAEEALNAAKAGTSFADIAKKYNTTVQNSKSFPRVGASAPAIGVSEELVNAAFGLNDKNLYPNKIFTVNNKRYLIKFAAREDISDEEYNKERPLLEKQLKLDKAENYYESYIEGLMSKADIKIFQEI